jgi:hypothetical protein
MALLKFSPEDRALLQEIDAVVDIPRNTKPEVVRKFYANTKRLIDQLRGLAPVLEARGSRTKRMTKADVRAVFATVPGAPLEELARWKRSGYSIDAMNALRMAEITKQMRYEQGQTADPTQSLRDDDDDFDPSDADDKDSHERAAEYHRACARKAPTMQRGADHFAAADKHSAAARAYPDLNSRFAARAASLKLADIS